MTSIVHHAYQRSHVGRREPVAKYSVSHAILETTDMFIRALLRIVRLGPAGRRQGPSTLTK